MIRFQIISIPDCRFVHHALCGLHVAGLDSGHVICVALCGLRRDRHARHTIPLHDADCRAVFHRRSVRLHPEVLCFVEHIKA